MRFVQTGVMLLGAALYVVMLEFLIQDDIGPDTLWWDLGALGLWTLVQFLATVITIIDSVLSVRARNAKRLATNAMVVKLASIPFFVLNYVVLACLFFGGLGFTMMGGEVIWIPVAIGSGMTYLVMLSTSVYTWAAIAQLRRDRIIGTGLTIVYAILSLLFFTDVAAAVLLFGHSRRRPRFALLWLLPIVGVTMIAVGVLGHYSGAFSNDDDIPTDILGLSLGSGLPLFRYLWAGLEIVGAAMILGTAIVGIIRRSALVAEARRAALDDGAGSGETVAEEPALAG